MLTGSYSCRLPGGEVRQFAMVDIGFMFLP